MSSSSSHSRSIRDPPKMSEPYTEWKDDVLIWSAYVVDKTPMNKQGMALFLSLEGDARKAAAKIKLPQMQTNDGLSKVLGELDKFYLKDKDRESFLAYERFTTFRRSEGVSMQDFLIKFELLRNTCSSYEVEIPDKIVAYQMLESANLPMMKKEVVKTTLTTYTADNMRSQILKIFSEEDVPNVSGHHDHTHIKSEPEEEVNVALFGSSGQKNRKGRRRDKPNYKQQANNSDNEGTLKTNPVDEFGEITTCDFCNSIYHYVPKCSDKRKSRKTGRRSGYQRKSYNPSL